MADLEEEIKSMGKSFRDLTYHSDGRWSCRLANSMFGTFSNKFRECWGNSPSAAVGKAKELLVLIETETRLLKQKIEDFE